MKIVIGIASCGRKDILSLTLQWLLKQTRPPDRIVVCAPASDDVDLSLARRLGVEVLTSGRGLPVQRNRILDALSDEELIIFLDDDFLIHPEFCRNLVRFMESNPEVTSGMGLVLRDGAREVDPIEFEEAVAILGDDQSKVEEAETSPTFNCYGCNMFYRTSKIREKRARFDERLVLYGWLEDVDFSRQISGEEPIPVIHCARGVHLGTPSGRSPGTRLGYSQVINPLYLARKGNVPWKYALNHAGRNVAANFTKVFSDSHKVDRWGRIKGNLLGLAFALVGRLEPEQAARL